MSSVVGTGSANLGSREYDQFGEKMRAITESGLAIDLNEDGTWVPVKLGGVPSQEGFRKASWGASPTEVKALEGAEPQVEQDDYLHFEVRLGSFACVAAYIFIGNQLVRGKYLVLEEYQNQTKYLTAYEELKDISEQEIRFSNHGRDVLAE